MLVTSPGINFIFWDLDFVYSYIIMLTGLFVFRFNNACNYLSTPVQFGGDG